jgi:hypothetical protein
MKAFCFKRPYATAYPKKNRYKARFTLFEHFVFLPFTYLGQGSVYQYKRFIRWVLL